jgi:Protein of unknown function (DUF2656)
MSFNPAQTRMLLSHNFNVSPDLIPPMSREEFSSVFQLGLSEHENLQCRLVHHPHWIVEILFSTDAFSPSQIGELCAKALADHRRSQQINTTSFPEILVLGGIKTTPPTSDAPEALQPGNWGVDVVETPSGEVFLQSIEWEATTAQRSSESFFKVSSKLN